MRIPTSVLIGVVCIALGSSCARDVQQPNTSEPQAAPQADATADSTDAIAPASDPASDNDPLVAVRTRARALLTSGEEKLLAGDYPGAVADLTEALASDPTLAAAHSHRGVALAKQEDFEAALADYTRALELDSELYIANYNRGRIYAKREDYDRAIADFTAAIEGKPNFARALSNRGFARAQVEDYEGAIKDLQAAKDIFLEEGDSIGYHRVSNAIRYMLP